MSRCVPLAALVFVTLIGGLLASETPKTHRVILAAKGRWHGAAIGSGPYGVKVRYVAGMVPKVTAILTRANRTSWLLDGESSLVHTSIIRLGLDVPYREDCQSRPEAFLNLVEVDGGGRVVLDVGVGPEASAIAARNEEPCGPRLARYEEVTTREPYGKPGERFAGGPLFDVLAIAGFGSSPGVEMDGRSLQWGGGRFEVRRDSVYSGDMVGFALFDHEERTWRRLMCGLSPGIKGTENGWLFEGGVLVLRGEGAPVGLGSPIGADSDLDHDFRGPQLFYQLHQGGVTPLELPKKEILRRAACTDEKSFSVQRFSRSRRKNRYVLRAVIGETEALRLGTFLLSGRLRVVKASFRKIPSQEASRPPAFAHKDSAYRAPPGDRR